jgi:hypothetical protein
MFFAGSRRVLSVEQEGETSGDGEWKGPVIAASIEDDGIHLEGAACRQVVPVKAGP